MNSRQYEKMMKEVHAMALKNAGIEENQCVSSFLSSDRTEYTVELTDGTTRIVPSGLPYFED
jgi:hypothetical protein